MLDEVLGGSVRKEMARSRTRTNGGSHLQLKETLQMVVLRWLKIDGWSSDPANEQSEGVRGGPGDSRYLMQKCS